MFWYCSFGQVLVSSCLQLNFIFQSRSCFRKNGKSCISNENRCRKKLIAPQTFSKYYGKNWFFNFLPSTYVVSPEPTSSNSFFHSFFYSVSNFLGIKLGNALVSGSGSDIPLIQDIEHSNSRARLNHATLRFFSLAEQCHTKIFYLRCFNSDFDAVKSKFGLLLE